MPINIFGSATGNSFKIVDTSNFVQRAYLRSIYFDSDIEEHIDMENQLKNRKRPSAVVSKEAAPMTYVDQKFDNPIIQKDTAPVDLMTKRSIASLLKN